MVQVKLFEYIANAYNLSTPSFERKHQYLCERCDIFFQYVNSGKRYPHWPTFTHFHKAVQSGCHVCRLFFAQLQPEERNLAFSHPETFLKGWHGCIRLFSHLRNGKNVYNVQVDFALSDAWSSMNDLDPTERSKLRTESELFTYLTLNEEEAGHSCTGASNLSPTSQNDEYKKSSYLEESDLAVRWLNECASKHELCKEPFYRLGSTPARLVYLGQRHDFSDVRLCTADTFGESPVYVTLSHSWGPNGIPSSAKLSSDSLLSLKARIAYENLPKTFQDAIAFARKLSQLNVQYIWIDALCILQGNDEISREDWLREGSHMNEIYQNSLCNLAACTGPDGSYGLFPKSDPFWKHVCPVTFGPQSCFHGSYTIRNMDVLGSRIRSGLITSRSWCVQELTLAPRILYFAPGRLAWTCSSHVAEDRRPSEHLTIVDCPELHMLSNMKADYKPVSTQQAHSELYAFWQKLILQHSMTKLTVHTDRLIAVSGIAKEMQMRFEDDDTYFVGLWGKYLHLQLLWWARKLESYRQRGYRAPSWSWAAVEGRVFNDRLSVNHLENSKSLVKIRPELKLETDSRFGPLKAGRNGDSAILHVEGPLLTARLGPRQGELRCQAPLIVENQPDALLVDLDFIASGEDEIDVFLLLLSTEKTQTDEMCISGLVLIRQLDSSAGGRYIRIGVGLAIAHRLLNLARSSRLPHEDLYETMLPNGDYKITII